MSSGQKEIPCDLCGSHVPLSKTSEVICGCPRGSLGCHRCRSIAGQKNSPKPGCCMYCYKNELRHSIAPLPDDLRCVHVESQRCRHCHQTIKWFSSSQVEAVILQNIRLVWERLIANKGLIRRNRMVAMMAQNWGMFSQFYCRNYCDHLMVNPWTKAKKQAFLQLWLLSEMNFPVVPCQIMKITSNLWESYPRSPLYISREFNWRFRQFYWVRKLILRFTTHFDSRCDALQLFRQSYLQRCGCTKHRIMLFIIRYLMSQHAEIFALSI